jgi:hypothetical protein
MPLKGIKEGLSYLSKGIKNVLFPKKKKSKSSNLFNKSNLMETEEALKVFNFETNQFTQEEVEQKFESMFNNNSVQNGGSLYLQAKFLIARNTLYNELGITKEFQLKIQKEREDNSNENNKDNNIDQQKEENVQQQKEENVQQQKEDEIFKENVNDKENHKENKA